MKKQLLSYLEKGSLCLLLACLFSASAFAQGRVISGQVTDAVNGDPLPGVSIIVKGTLNGTSTDFDGNFRLNVNDGDTLQFSYVGYLTTTRGVGSASVLNVGLEPDLAQLDEVVVIGYGTTTAKDATGSLTSVGEEDFNKGNIVTPENLLNGRVAGLTVNTGGEPGAGSVIRIRGGASLGASNDPLIIINGLPVDNNNVGGSRSILSSINPNDIESFTVLKDASATAIYGSRASNGVILITTKTAGSDLRVNLDLQTGINTPTKTLDVYSADDYRALIAERDAANGTDLSSMLGEASTDWQEEVLRDQAANNTANLSVQGTADLGGFQLPVRASAGYSYQEGLLETSRFQRLTGSVSMTPTLLNGSLKLALNLNGAEEKNRFADAGQLATAQQYDPTQPVYADIPEMGGYYQYLVPEDQFPDDGFNDPTVLAPQTLANPVAELQQRRATSQVERVYGNFKIDYNLPFFTDLTAVVNLGLDHQFGYGINRNSSTSRAYSQIYAEDADGNVLEDEPIGWVRGYHDKYHQVRNNYLLDAYLQYDKTTLGDALNVQATAGYSYQRFEREDFSTGSLLTNLRRPLTTRDTDLILIGLFARANLTYDNKYVLTLTYRRDGTSRFSEDNRWGDFPSAALAWKVNEEFFPGNKTISTLKLRAAWGVTGQQDIGRDNTDLFRATTTTAPENGVSQYIFGSQVIRPAQPNFRNEDLKWEETTTINFGVDFGILNDRFTGTVEYFNKRSEDLLAFAAISDGSNFSNSGFQNLGTFVSQGLELTLNGDVIPAKKPGDFNWNLNYNLTVIRTEIEELALGQDELVGGIGGGTGGTIQVHREGFTPFSFFVYKQIYDEDGDPIEGAYADLNGDNQINADDRYIHHNNQPSATMGLLSNMSYRDFDLSFNLRAVFGNYVYNNVNSTRAYYDQITILAVPGNIPRSVEDTDFEVRNDGSLLSDHYIENASFLRLDNVTLGYTFRDVGLDNSSVRVSAGVQNAFVITNYSGLDPEVFNNGIDNTIYPRARTFFLGANISF